MGIVNYRKSVIVLVILFSIATITSVTRAEGVIRSSSLQEVTTIEGNTERTDFVDADGNITFAADKHYATVIKTTSDHQLLEEYFDANGEHTEQSTGYYALLREYNEADQEFKVTFLGLDGKPVMNSHGYAISMRFYNENGYAEKELYYDTEEKPVKTRYNGYGIYKKYDETGKNTVLVHLDENGNPMVAGNGYAIIHRSFYEEGNGTGRVKDEFYFDENEEPVTLSLGQSGLHKEYDELGRTRVLTYLDAEGNPIKTTKGYTTIIRTFYDDDSVRTEMYFDQEGEPIRLSEGQYGILKQDGKTIYLDANGNRLFQLKNFLINNQAAVILIAIAIVLIASLLNKKVNIGLFVLYIVFIIYITIVQRNDVRTGIELRFLWSYRQFLSSKTLRWEIFNNILLFIPLGAILYKLYPKKSILLVPVLVSLLIELTQYATGTGLCELDDVISNGLGGCIGYGAGQLLTGTVMKWIRGLHDGCRAQ